MKKPTPLIKLNGGKPVALCNRCFAMMCYVKCYGEIEEGKCVVIEVRDNGREDYIKTPIGDLPPSYCDKCKFLLSYSINE